MKTSLYRFYGEDDELLYVGLSKNPFTRLGQHIGSRGEDMTSVSLIRVQWLDTRFEAEQAERSAIELERPAWNVHFVKPQIFRLAPDQCYPDVELGDVCEDFRVTFRFLLSRKVEDARGWADYIGLRAFSIDEISEEFGFDVDQFAIRNRSNKEAAEAMLKDTKEQQNE